MSLLKKYVRKNKNMKKIYLTSEFNKVAETIYKDIGLKNPKTAFIYTAAEEHSLEREWFLKEKQALIDNNFDITEYTITGKTQREVELFLEDFDVIYVCGGYLFYLMERIKESGFDRVLNKVLEDKIFIGQSAGSIITGSSISLETNPPKTTLKDFSGLKLVNFIIVPHWGAKELEGIKEVVVDKIFEAKDNIVLLNNNSYIFSDGKSFKLISV